MNGEEGGILSFLDKVVEIDSTFLPIPRETIPEVEPDEEAEYRPRDYQEKSFEDILCGIYDSYGLQYERQKRVANGIIDIFVYGQPPNIIEVKRSGTPFNLWTAIVQLKFYGACFKEAGLYIAVPGNIPKQHLPILRQFGIGELEMWHDDKLGRMFLHTHHDELEDP